MNEEILNRLKTQLPGNTWPVIPTAAAATQLAIQIQLEYSQWLDEATIRKQQFNQVRNLLKHALEQVPYYRERLAGFKIPVNGDLSMSEWQQVPLLVRSDIQDAGEALLARSLPSREHGPVNKIQTSGSTGMPITAYGTSPTRLLWNAITLRDHIWQKRDLDQKLAAIRPEGKQEPGRSIEFGNWGLGTNLLVRTGKSLMLSSSTPIDEQAEWLYNNQPAYLLSLPSNIIELGRYMQGQKRSLSGLKQIRTYGEVAGDEVYDIANRVWNAPVSDMYSCSEAGYISLQCPQHRHQHVQSENLIVEIIDDEGNVCKAGETGRVVLTTLHNFAAPLIRYVLGDYAIAGKPCDCGRGLPVIERVLGRERNMLTLPSGQTHYPSFPAEIFTSVAPVRQFQLRQKSVDHIEVRLVSERTLKAAEEQDLIRNLQERLRYPFQITLHQVEIIERSVSGKFEDFISDIKK